MSEDTPKIGIITEIEGTDVNNIDKTHRRKWANALSEKLAKISGIEEVTIEPAVPDYQEVVFYARVDADSVFKGYQINCNLRSVSQHIRSTLEDDMYASANILEPEVTAPEKEEGSYNNDMYEITVFYP